MITTVDEYRQATAALRHSVQQLGEGLEANVHQMGDFLRYRAAKRRFFPEHAADDLAFFLDTQYNMQLSAQLESKVSGALLLGQARAEGDTAFVEQQGQQAYIFCTFHFGSYQMVGTLLRKLGFDFSVLTLREGITSDMLHKAAATDRLDVLHADSPSVMLEMHNTLQAGKSIMAFIDGNPDAVSEANSKSYARVDLLGHKLLAKKGIPSLAYAAGVPIVPIVSYRVGPDDVRVVFGAPIVPSRAVPRAAYVQHALQSCYGLLEQYLRTRPEQWLYWRMIHHYLDLGGAAVASAGPPLVPSYYTFNQQRYEMYQGRQYNYLYDQHRHEAFAVSANLLAYLRYIVATPDTAAAVAVRINPTLRQELLAKQVLRGVSPEEPS
ncbi:hypothetical protein ACVWYF_004532 [Hymenobacter sp. UYAg731]